MNDSEIVDRLRRINSLGNKVSDLIYEIENSDHPRAAELAEDLWQQCWFAASAEHVGIHYLDRTRWTIQRTINDGYGRIVSRALARKRRIETVD